MGFDLVINLHYLNPKWSQALSYVVNWNPLEYIVDDPISGRPVPSVHLEYLADCLRSHDRVLTAGSTVLDDYAAKVRRNNQGRKFLGSARLALHATIQKPEGAITPLTVNANSFRVFYIGTNWEKLSQADNRQIRHQGLFEALDSSGRFSFFGLRQQDGIKLWEGIEGYQGDLPFDGGQSILSKTRECGVALVLSSPQHLSSGVVSTRLFQAAAAGAVIIADQNPFIQQEFSDSILYFNYGNTPAESANNILQQVKWIEENWEQALAKAELAQRIYFDRFALDNEVAQICEQAEKDITARAQRVAYLNEITVAVHWILRDITFQTLEHGIRQLSDQSHKNFQLILYGDARAITQAKHHLDQICGIESKAYQLLPTAKVGASLELASNTVADWHIWFNPAARWARDHLFSMIDAAVSESAVFCYSPFFNGLAADQSDDVTMAFFIKGLNGGFTRLTERRLVELDSTEIAFSSMLIHSELLSDALQQQPSVVAMDLMALLLIAQYAHTQSSKFAFVPQITSTFHADLRNENGVSTEYASLPGAAKFGVYRDANTYFMLHGGSAVIASRYDREIQLGKLSERVSSVEYLVKPEQFSTNFSLFAYLLHLFRRRPLTVRCLRKLQSILAKVMG
jgi:hypothetical protein